MKAIDENANGACVKRGYPAPVGHFGNLRCVVTFSAVMLKYVYIILF